MITFQNAMDYWARSDEGHDQHFYTAYCCLATALLNYVAGQDFRTEFPEWSVAANYYSAVHSLRTLLLVSCGDFPTSHATLANFLEGYDPKEKRSIDKQKGGWLRLVLEANPQYGTDFTISDWFLWRSTLVEWLEGLHYILKESAANEWIIRWGQSLRLFKQCREKLNYEGLIVAHRAMKPHVSHGIISMELPGLINACEELSEEALRTCISIFQSFIERDGNRRKRWSSYLNWEKHLHHENSYEGVLYLEGIIPDQHKSPFMKKCFRRLRSINGQQYEPEVAISVFNNISLDHFDPKARYFDDFKQLIIKACDSLHN